MARVVTKRVKTLKAKTSTAMTKAVAKAKARYAKARMNIKDASRLSRVVGGIKKMKPPAKASRKRRSLEQTALERDEFGL